jgi:hypothetical protein
MNTADAEQLIARYAVSYYAEPGGACSAAEVRKAKEELRAAGALLTAMEENIAEAKLNYDSVRRRYLAAQRDGLFDLDAMQTVNSKATKRTFDAWAAAMETQVGDKVRAISEIKHWREYWTWAKGNPTAKPMDVRALADAKSYEDMRLPAEAR